MKMEPPPPGTSALLERLVEASPQGMLAVDRKFRYLLWNPEMERISGLKANEVLGKCAFDLFPFLVESGEDQIFREALAGKHMISKNRPFRVEGTQRSGVYEAEYWPWQDGGGEILGAFVILRDVTNAKHKEQLLYETESRFKNMADASPVLLWMSRNDGLCTFFNQTWLTFTGRTLEEEWGVGWAEGVYFEDFQRCMDTYTDAFNRREVFEMEYRLKRSDGEYRWILDRGTPRYAPDGSFEGYIGSCVDITDRKHLEQELREAVNVRDEFLSIASHELRTPLTALQLQLESLQRTLLKQAEDEFRNRIVQNSRMALEKVRNLDSMVQVLLDVSRLSRGRMQLEYEEFDLSDLLREVMEGLKQSAQEAGCEIQLHCENAPRGQWDRLRVQQVVTNLLANAIKFGAKKPIALSVRSNPEHVEIDVTDHGLGIPPEHQPQLFERFTRFVSSKHYGGLGLGLWICKEIANAHGGRIRVQSEVGHGATFVVELPTSPTLALARTISGS